MRSPVALVRCDSYEDSMVLDAVRRAVELIGGVERFIAPGQSVLVKPNLLAADPPERATDTHPAVFGAVATLLLECGAKVSYGDSPGTGSPVAAARRSGIAAVAERLGLVSDGFSEQALLALPEGNAVGAPTVPVARAVVDADVIVSVPKLKTHALMRLTGAVKNQLGCVFGVHKARMHLIAPEANRFGELMVDINRAVAPRLYIMDAVVAMEGNGPRNGSPRHVGAILASADPVALDATACRLIGLDPTFVPTNVVGMRTGHGTYLEDEIDLLGDPLATLACPDFDVVRSPAHHHILTHLDFMRNLLSPRPEIDAKKCRVCGVCVEACPVPAKAVRFIDEPQGSDGTSGRPPAETRKPPEFNYDICIRCYCCQEMCPHDAIRVRTPLLGRLPGIRGIVGAR